MTIMHDEPDILDGINKLHETEPLQKAQSDLTELNDEEFLYRYKATKHQYQTLLNAVHELQKVNDVLSEMGALAIDPEIGENTTLLIDDYLVLLDQMHGANFWNDEENR